MEAALDLLDTVGELNAPPHLDAAILHLGIRRPPTVPAAPGVDLSELTERYYHQRAEQHLQLAEAEPDATSKGLHLNLASRYATLRELAARSDSGHPSPTST